jgi:hypothetical protein
VKELSAITCVSQTTNYFWVNSIIIPFFSYRNSRQD